MSVISVSHPLVKHKLGMLRNIETNSKDFRELITELTTFLTYEATKDWELEDATVPGWEGKPVYVQRMAGIDPSIVPIFRAGIGMQEGFMQVIPTAKISYIGYYRDAETLQPKLYYAKLAADISRRKIYVLDPMLATGGTTSAVCRLLKKEGCKNIRVLCILAAPEGLEKMAADHPDVDIMPAVVDSHLNDKGYIVPGLGDAGDRLFGTK
ncbi:uracil phosphoribosyltransferase [Methanomicrobium sp. W14]|jgi:uracil phosphoribosyltransferase|uniref:uracil phosphoribosyltransferase n=1 Tax=Methanomicrobium sp. W14 TaxID=2817839 RepID=UPI001AE7D309|nr:uracil phosphoribosyltransferase [Methanomicrobium sp. W14]MBP2133355.1 uracil phosphoribosyltransferase [Methanomicrobium sp. W14]